MTRIIDEKLFTDIWISHGINSGHTDIIEKNSKFYEKEIYKLCGDMVSKLTCEIILVSNDFCDSFEMGECENYHSKNVAIKFIGVKCHKLGNYSFSVPDIYFYPWNKFKFNEE